MKLIEQCALKIKTYNKERVHLIFAETNKSACVALDVLFARELDSAHATVNFSTISQVPFYFCRTLPLRKMSHPFTLVS